MNFGKQPKMHQQQTEILDQIDRFTIAIDRSRDVDDRERWAISAKLLLRSRRVSRWTHECGLTYLTAHSRRPLSTKSLARSIAVFQFCDGGTRSLLMKAEIEKYFPFIFRHGLSANHYVVLRDAAPRLGHVRVDIGESRINRLLSRTERLIHKYRSEHGFRGLIDEQRFEVSWIVPTTAKQRRLSEALAPLSSSGVGLSVCAMPLLLNIIHPIPEEPVLTHSPSRV